MYADGAAAAAPWSLELLPLLIEPADWAQIEAGVAQRARLLDAMLADVYGPQRLLHEALLPPALLFRHPRLPAAAARRARRRATCGCTSPPSTSRAGPTAAGGWCAAHARPVGPGLRAAQPAASCRASFPEAFRELQVQHLASSYRRLLDTVFAQAGALAGGATPRVVLLTPGPYNETYFEHAYLARYLGLPLVEGGDLTVRDERLYLKTVEGLEPVHGVLRRLDDDFCDPLELRPDSTLGVPGLLQAVRAGNVVMANALGSGFLESPALQGFLPAIARRLLGEELALPSLPTWWCGERAAWQQVRAELAGKVVRQSFERGTGAEALPGAGAALSAWRETIDADPDAFTLQARLPPSRAPLWAGGAFDARPALLRVYAIADCSAAGTCCRAA